MPQDVADLVAAAKHGDREAFDELVRVTYADTYTLACRLIGNEEDARDVVQEAYLRAYRGLRRFRGDAPVEGGRNDDLPRLSEREGEVLRLIVKGFTYAEIADLLGVSSHTVTTHVRGIYRKLEVHSRSEAVYEALQLGLVKVDE